MKEYIEKAAKQINQWLSQFGYTLDYDTEVLDDDVLGLYEAGSVFEKEIQVHLNPAAIHEACLDLVNDTYSNPNTQVQITLYHEVGHALVEQIADWMENIPEINQLCSGPFGKKYSEIINDGKDEEEVVEDFAYGFFNRTSSPLQECWEELNHFIKKS